MLGGHFAAAGQAERAAHYLELAGDRAARIFANDEAIGLYRQVLAVVDGGPAAAGTGQRVPGPAQIATGVAVCQKLAALLILVDRFDEDRAVALNGIARAPAEEPLWAARLHLLLGNLEYQDLHRGAALDALEAAEKLVGPCGLDDDQERIDIWLGVQLTKACTTAQANEVERAASVLADARPLAEARGSPGAVADLHSLLEGQHILARRHLVDAALVEELRSAARAAQAVEGTTWDRGRNPETMRYSAMVVLGRALTWYGDLDEARQAVDHALSEAERAGTPNGRGMALAELALIALRQGDVELVRELLPQARGAAAGPGTGDNWNYVMAATAAMEAWAAWREGRTEKVIAFGTEALELWKSQVPSYQLRCWALFPLASAHLDLGETQKAVDAARQTLDQTQARLPDKLEAAVRAACETWDRGDPQQAGRLVGGSVALARELRYA